MLSLKVFLKGGITFSIIVTRSSSLGVDLWTESPGIVASLPSAAAMIRPFMSIGSENWFHAFYYHKTIPDTSPGSKELRPAL